MIVELLRNIAGVGQRGDRITLDERSAIDMQCRGVAKILRGAGDVAQAEPPASTAKGAPPDAPPAPREPTTVLRKETTDDDDSSDEG